MVEDCHGYSSVRDTIPIFIRSRIKSVLVGLAGTSLIVAVFLGTVEAFCYGTVFLRGATLGRWARLGYTYFYLLTPNVANGLVSNISKTLTNIRNTYEAL